MVVVHPAGGGGRVSVVVRWHIRTPPPPGGHTGRASVRRGLLSEKDIRVFGWGMDMTIFQTFTFSDGQRKTRGTCRVERYKRLIYSIL